MGEQQSSGSLQRNTTTLRVDGMSCSNCARKVTDALKPIAGVASVSVEIETGRASIKWSAAAPPRVEAAITALERAGYSAQSVPESETAPSPAHSPNLTLWLGTIVTLALMLGEWVFGLGMEHWFRWTAFGLAGAVQIFCGAQFYRGAWRQLRAGSSNMDTLVALGSTTAFGYSAWVLLSGRDGHVFFMEAAAIVTLISIGHWLETRVTRRASDTLRALIQLAPRTARRVRPDQASGTALEQDVPVTDLSPGDLILLRPGESFPTDGIVIEGASAVNESMLTGESLPADKSAGAKVFAGTINVSGRLVVRVTDTGETTALAQIIAAVQRAQTSRADIQRLGDRVSNVFVPIVVGIALLAGLWWTFDPGTALRVHDSFASILWHAPLPDGAGAGFVIAAAVLIIACPCAMGLATPAAVMAAVNAAARRGILIRDGIALEKAGRITTVIFDKTGTLTTGRHELAASESFLSPTESRTSRDIFAMAASLAADSNHPLSKTVATITTHRTPTSGFTEIPGCGIRATNDDPSHRGEVLRLGSLRWLTEDGVDTAPASMFAGKWQQDGATVIAFAVDSKIIAAFALRDSLKPDAHKVIERLRSAGRAVQIISGDAAQTAHAIGRQLGLSSDDIRANVRPGEKAAHIATLQARGERVAFVGDGINDAPALARADLGIAVLRASDVARESADIILLRAEIAAVPEALGLSAAALRTIKQNLFWAFFYNALGVPLAALGFISPVLCAAAMGLSDLIVIGNALRLSRWNDGGS